MSNIYEFFKLFQPVDCGLSKIRLGSRGDGGYVVIKEAVDKSNRIYSIGIQEENWTFEYDLLTLTEDREYTAFVFDVNNKYDIMQQRRMVFKNRNVLKDVPIFENDSILKVNFEGNEWDLFLALGEHGLEKIDMIVVKFHFLHYGTPDFVMTKHYYDIFKSCYEKGNELLFSKYLSALRIIMNKFYLCHIHPDNSIKRVNINGYIFPPLIECTFINKDIPDNVIAVPYSSFPVAGLDFRNRDDRSDVKMEFKSRRYRERC